LLANVTLESCDFKSMFCSRARIIKANLLEQNFAS